MKRRNKRNTISFSQYVDVEVDVEIELDEFIEECDVSQIEEIINLLKEKGYFSAVLTDKKTLVSESYFNEDLMNLSKNYLMLSIEDMEIIENISKKY